MSGCQLLLMGHRFLAACCATQIEDLKRLMQPETRAVFTNFPHNPSGAMVSRGDWQQVIDCCRCVGAVLFSDEMYRWGPSIY